MEIDVRSLIELNCLVVVLQTTSATTQEWLSKIESIDVEILLLMIEETKIIEILSTEIEPTEVTEATIEKTLAQAMIATTERWKEMTAQEMSATTEQWKEMTDQLVSVTQQLKGRLIADRAAISLHQ